MRFKSLYIARFLLEMTGVLLAVFGIFSLFLIRAPREPGDQGRMILTTSLMLVCSVGFLTPTLWAKFSSAVLLAGAGVWTFYTDAYRWRNLAIYCLLFTPLVLTFWLRAGYNKFNIQRLPNAN